MAISRELTQKVRKTDSDEEDEEEEENVEHMENKEDEEDEELLKTDKLETNAEIKTFVKLCREYFDAKRQTKGEEIEEDGILDEIISEEEKETSCHNEKSNTSQANDAKNKLCGNEKSSISQEYKSEAKNKLCGNEKNSTLQANKNDTKNKSCNNEKSSTSLANTNDMKDKIHKEKKKNFTCDTVDTTSEWYVENCELLKLNYDKQNNKKSKSRDTNEMLIDSKKSKKENPKRKLNLKAQVKKKLKANNKMEKHGEEQKENEDYSPSLEFEDPKRKPILDSPLEETTSRENVQKDSDLTNLKTIANTVRDSASTNHEVELDLKKYDVNIKPKHLKTHLPNVATAGDEDSEQEEEMHRIMSEAFADDDADEEFRKEKEEEVRKKNFK